MHCGIGLTFASGEKADHQCRGTVIWEWEGDRWRLAHEVFSAPAEPGQPVFQATRPHDPRIEPHAELMQRKYIASSIKRVKITLNNNLEAQRRGKIAWSNATLHIETELMNGKSIPGDARQSLIWYLTDDGWRIVHEHFSFPQ